MNNNNDKNHNLTKYVLLVLSKFNLFVSEKEKKKKRKIHCPLSRRLQTWKKDNCKLFNQILLQKRH